MNPFEQTTNEVSNDIFDYGAYGNTDDVYGGYS
jgi:hypothetical protein